MRRTGPIILITVGGLLLIAAVVGFGYARRLSSPMDASLPPSLGGVRLVSALYGKEAVKEITRLHGEEFNLTSGAVGTYGDRSDVTLWVAGAGTGLMATRMISAMREAIAAGNSPFSPLDTIERVGRTIYRLTGMGQRHHYFRSGSVVVWLAADENLADEALDDALESYP